MNEARATDARPGRRGALGTALRWSVTIACVVALVTLVDVREAWDVARGADPLLLAGAVALGLVDRLVMIAKWYPLVRIQAPEIGLGLTARAYFAGGAAQVVVPTPVSGDVVRAIVIGRRMSGVPEIGASIVLERALGIVGSGMACIVALLLALRRVPELEPALPWALGALAAAIAGLAATFHRAPARLLAGVLAAHSGSSVAAALARFGAAYRRFASRRGLLVGVALASAAEQFVPALCLWCVALALGSSATLLDLAIAVPLCMLVARLPVAVGGFGLGEGALVALLAALGVPAPEGLAIGVIGALVTVAVAAPGAVVWPGLARRDADGP